MGKLSPLLVLTMLSRHERAPTTCCLFNGVLVLSWTVPSPTANLHSDTDLPQSTLEFNMYADESTHLQSMNCVGTTTVQTHPSRNPGVGSLYGPEWKMVHDLHTRTPQQYRTVTSPFVSNYTAQATLARLSDYTTHASRQAVCHSWHWLSVELALSETP